MTLPERWSTCIDLDAVVVPRADLNTTCCEVCNTAVGDRCVVNTRPPEYFCACKCLRAYAEEDMPESEG